MTGLLYFFYLLEAGFFGAFCYLFYRLYRSAERRLPQWWGPLPSVSILVAARNEEANLSRCLDALVGLDYPTSKLDVWIGNDHSEDATATIARQYQQAYGHVHTVDIQDNVGLARGKANVLAQLAGLSRGRYLMVCDADILVNPDWVQNMLAIHQNHGVDAVTGSTVGLPGNTLWTDLQAFEWLYYMSIFKTLDTLGHSTAMGNNMSITRDAYKAVGGYESIPFSVTEDYALYQVLMHKGFHHEVVYHAGVRNYSMPLADYATLLHQKRRWARGAAQLPWRIKWLMLLHAAFFPVLLGHALLGEAVEAVLAFAVFVALMQAVLHFGQQHLSLQVSKRARWLFPLHLAALNLIGPWFAAFHRKVKWKGRQYA